MRASISTGLFVKNNRDLINAGMQAGPALGEVLDQMLKDVIEEPEHNNKEYLLKQYVSK